MTAIGKDLKLKRLLGFHDRGCQNVTDYNLQRTLSSFNLLLDPTVKDGDCLFISVLKQLNKLLFTNSNDEFSSHIAALDLLHEDKTIAMLKLRSAFCFVFFDFVRCSLWFELILYQKMILTEFCFLCMTLWITEDLIIWGLAFDSVGSILENPLFIRHRNSLYWL